MTGHKRTAAPESQLANTDVGDRLAAAVPELTIRVIERLVDEVPVYRLLPAEQLDGEISEVVERNLRSFVEVLRTGQVPCAAEPGYIREAAARRAEEHVPLEMIIAAYHVGTRVSIGWIVGSATASDLADLPQIHELTLRYLHEVSAAACGGYLEERQTQVGDEEAARQALLSALLDGRTEEYAVARAGISLPAGYVVISIAVGAHPDESEPGVDPAIVARRKIRRLRGELDRRTRGTALSQLSATGGIVLVPRPSDDPVLSEREWGDLRELRRAASVAAGADATAGVVLADTVALPAAARLAAEVREVAEWTRRRPGLYRLDDVLLDYQLTRPSPALEQLAAALLPLESKPDLQVTLDAYLKDGMDRRATAKRLHVHPNTVDYRLRRVAELCGLDPTRALDQPRLRAALAAGATS